MSNFREKTDFLWSLAELLRGDYHQSDYGKVILPLVVLRRLDCVLEPTKVAVLDKNRELQTKKIENVEPILKRAAKEQFYNVSPLDLPKLLGDPENVADNLRAYIAGFSPGAQDIIEKFKFEGQIETLDKANLLYLLLQRFVEIDLHPEAVSNLEMGYMFEELIRRFSEQSNETAGEHFTPREVVRLMVNLLFVEDDDLLRTPGTVRTLYDPACGTGGMLSVAEDYLRELNPKAKLEVFGQELNDQSYAICRSDMMLKGQDASHIHVGNSFTNDGVPHEKFDYMLSNPPFGVEWKKVETDIRKEYEQLGSQGRFGAGLPRITDGSLLFLQHMISKMRLVDKGGSRIAIVFNGSPLFTGAAGSGESEIRRWIIENDWLEAVVALPDQLFYNTGIFTYIWVVTNRKPASRKGKVQLIDARSFFKKMTRSLGDKRNELSEEHIAEITLLFNEFKTKEYSIVLDNEQLGFRRITLDRPLRLRYEVRGQTIDLATASKPWQRLIVPAKGSADPQADIEAGEKLQQRLERALTEMCGERFEAATEIEARLSHALGGDLAIPKPLLKAIIDATSVRDEDVEPLRDKKGNLLADTELRDYENVPLLDDIDEYVEEHVLPHVPDAWIADREGKVGYEIPLTRYFYRYETPRPVEEIDSEIKVVEAEILELLKRVTA